jgi:hypothetical protein
MNDDERDEPGRKWFATAPWELQSLQSSCNLDVDAVAVSSFRRTALGWGGYQVQPLRRAE